MKLMGKIEWNFGFFSNYIRAIRQRPIDGIAFTFLIIASLLTYLNGTYVLLPRLFAELPLMLIFVGCLITTWIFTAILSNLFLIRYRDSSIVNRMLIQPTIKTSKSSNSSLNSDDIVREQTKSLGQHFMANPFGGEENWHICATCEIFVPPRAWHCTQCKTCILRRDHHCIFAMTCIGEENHSNFLGLVMYLAIGSSLATAVNIIYTLLFTNTSFWWFFIKSFIPFYTLIFDFSILNILCAVNFLGMWCAWLVFINYLMMAFRNQTCVIKKEASRSDPYTQLKVQTKAKYTYSNAVKFLGRNPVLRIFWPFHPALKNTYGPTDVLETRKEQ